MSMLDLVILAVLSISVGIGIRRGFARELLSLGKWLIATLFAWIFAEDVTGMFSGVAADETTPLVLGFLFIFAIVFVFGSVITFFIHRLFTARPFLKFWNTILGSAIGGVRGFVILVVAFLLAALMPALPQSEWWERSLLAPYIESAALFTGEFLPRDIARHIHYD